MSKHLFTVEFDFTENWLYVSRNNISITDAKKYSFYEK